jgi:hypothetical protein
VRGAPSIKVIAAVAPLPRLRAFAKDIRVSLFLFAVDESSIVQCLAKVKPIDF